MSAPAIYLTQATMGADDDCSKRMARLFFAGIIGEVV